MAPLPPNTTVRYFVDYAQGPQSHTLMVRGSTGSTQASADTAIDDFLTNISALLVETVITGVRRADAGSDISFPVTSALTGNTYGVGASNEIAAARQLTFTGRSPDGRRTRTGMFGMNFNLADYRQTSGESATIDATVDALNSYGTDFVSISGQTAIWNGYGNYGLNDHWVKEAR